MPWIVGGAILGGSLVSGGLGFMGSQSNADAISQASQASLGPRWTNSSGVNVANASPTDFNYLQGHVYIDPSIRALREQQLANIPGYRSSLGAANTQYQNQLGALQTQLAGNANPFMQARLNPLLQQQAQGRADLSSDFARRGVFGSLNANALGNYDEATNRGIADQGALVTQDTLNAQRALTNDQYAGARQAVTDYQSLDAQQAAIANQNLQQELASLGLSQANIQGLLGAAQLGIQNTAQANQIYGQSLYAGGTGLGALAAGLGGPSAAAVAAPGNYGYNPTTGLSSYAGAPPSSAYAYNPGTITPGQLAYGF